MPDDEVTQLAQSRLGRVLKGKYRLDRVLGIGGMAVVYAATHRNKKKFAIKMLHPELSLRENIRTRFLREGYVANTVEHPGAVAVLDDDVAEDGSAFVVMELLEGAPLDAVWARHDRHLPLALVLSVGDALLDVLASAHAKGVVHRDIKPANVFLTSDGRLEVLDFGIARLHDATSSDATQTGAMMGTPAYMAPEQALAKTSEVDAQADLWAVGATLFTLLTGELVHAGENASQILVAAATKKARPVRSVATDVPTVVAEVIDKALAFEKAERWASAGAMREALAKACVEATGAPIAALPKTESIASVTGHEETVTSGAGATPASSDAAFEPTVDARSGAPLGQTTGAPISKARPIEAKVTRPARWRRLALVGAACAVTATGLYVYRAAHAPRTRYCLVLRDTIDGPRCESEMSAEVAATRRRMSQRVTEVAGHVVTVDTLNFAGLPLDDYEDSALRWEVVRDDHGAVHEIIKRERHGVIVEWQKWSEGGKRIDFVDDDGVSPRHHANDSYTTLRVDYDEHGRRTRERYFGPTGRPRRGTQESDEGFFRAEAYGYEYEYGKTPTIRTKQTSLAADGKPGASQNGLASQVTADDGTPFGRDRRAFDLDGRPYLVDGYWHSHLELVEGQPAGGSFFGLQEEPVVYLPEGQHSWHETWDSVSRTWTASCADESGHPTRLRGERFYVIKRTFDARGRSLEQQYLDAQGNPVVWTDGATRRYTHDDRDEATSKESLDASGELMANTRGCARQVFKRNVQGVVEEVRCYDAAGKLTPSHQFGAIERQTHNEHFQQTSWADFDAKEQPLADETGVATGRFKYDRLGNQVETLYLGTDGKPVVGTRGFAMQRATIDENDDVVLVTYLDAGGLPTTSKDGYATQRMKYEERGLPVEEAYSDVHGEPTFGKEGYASVKRTYDRNGDVIREEYFGKRGKPIAREGGYASVATKYDVHRHAIERALFHASGKPVVGSQGWAIERTAYDDRSLVARIDHLDAAGNPSLDEKGRASLTRAYDARGNLVEARSLGIDGKSVTATDGYATKRNTYDDRDQLIEEGLFGPDGAAVAGKEAWSVRRVRYDDLGDMTEEAFLDAAHQPVVPKELTYASRRQRFDERHHLAEAAYFDVGGTPVKGPDGAAVVRYERNTYGDPTRMSYLDGAGAPTASKDGKVVVLSAYDAVNRLVEERFVDAFGAPRVALDGCAGHATKYDAQGHKVEESCLDTKDGVTLSASGWAYRRTLHDAHGNDVDVSTYAPDGSLHADADGVARRRNRFDERNQMVETAFFDAADKPTHDKRGVSVTRLSYDDSGKKSGETTFDEKGRPVVVKAAVTVPSASR